MTPLMTLLIVIMALVVAGVVLFLGGIIGMFGSTKPRRPPMTIGVIDLSGLQYGLNMEVRWIKYHPSTGFFKQHVEMPTETGKVQVQERSGFFGMRKNSHVWDESAIMMIGEKKGGWAVYHPEFLAAVVKERMDKMDVQNRMLREQNADLQDELEKTKRAFNQQIEDAVEKRIKNVQQITPVPMPRGKTGGGPR